MRDGVYEPEILIGGGFPAAEGWCATIAAPHLLDSPKSADWVKRYAARFSKQPNDYCITALSRIRWLFVIARNSSFTYKGRSVDVKLVGRDLGVRYVLEGSVRKAAHKVRCASPGS